MKQPFSVTFWLEIENISIIKGVMPFKMFYNLVSFLSNVNQGQQNVRTLQQCETIVGTSIYVFLSLEKYFQIPDFPYFHIVLELLTKKLTFQTLYAYIKLIVFPPPYNFNCWDFEVAHRITQVLIMDDIIQRPILPFLDKETHLQYGSLVNNL